MYGQDGLFVGVVFFWFFGAFMVYGVIEWYFNRKVK